MRSTHEHEPELVGTAQRRVDGHAKVTGGARYAAEFAAADLLHGAVVSGAIAKGRITGSTRPPPRRCPASSRSTRTRTGRARPGSTRPTATRWRPPATRSARSDRTDHVLAASRSRWSWREDFETATYAASLVEVSYDAEAPKTDLDAQSGESYEPPKKRSGIEPPPKPRGHADQAYAAAPVQVRQEYRVAVEHHNPMEPHATTVVWEGDGSITVHDKIQGVTNTQGYVTGVFGLSKDRCAASRPSWAAASARACARNTSSSWRCWRRWTSSAPCAWC